MVDDGVVVHVLPPADHIEAVQKGLRAFASKHRLGFLARKRAAQLDGVRRHA